MHVEIKGLWWGSRLLLFGVLPCVPLVCTVQVRLPELVREQPGSAHLSPHKTFLHTEAAFHCYSECLQICMGAGGCEEFSRKAIGRLQCLAPDLLRWLADFSSSWLKHHLLYIFLLYCFIPPLLLLPKWVEACQGLMASGSCVPGTPQQCWVVEQ